MVGLGLLTKRAFGRVNTSITAFALILIVTLSSLHHVAALSTSLTVNSSGTISYDPINNLTRPLHVEGRYVKDDLGNIIYLRGVNKPGFEDHHAGIWIAYDEYGNRRGGQWHWNEYAVKANLDEMKRRGCNVVRLITAIDWWFLDGTFWAYDGSLIEYKQHLRDILTWANERGIYVIFTPYQVVNWRDSQATRDALPYPPYSNPGAETFIPDEQAFIDYIVTVASEFGKYPNFILELWNEPHGDARARASWLSVAQQCIDAVRAAGINNVIIIQWDYGVWANLLFRGAGTVEWINDPNRPKGTNVVYSTHAYRNYGGLGQVYDPVTHEFLRYGYTYEEVLDAFRLEKLNWVGEALNQPLLIGELGANLYAEDLTEELGGFKNAFDILNAWGLGYLGWWWRSDTHRRLIDTYPKTAPEGVALSPAGQILMDAISEGRWWTGIYSNVSSPILGEIDVTDGAVKVLRSGDANGDGHCDGYDFAMLNVCWLAMYPDDRYNPNADFNGDGIIDGFDFTSINVNWLLY